MCHLIFLMPLFGLPIFWLAPLSLALPSYTVILLVSGILYWFVVKAMRKPLRDGFHSLLGTEAQVVSKLAPDHFAQYLVRSQGELWSAYAKDTFRPGEPANIVAIQGISLVIERADKTLNETVTT